MILETLNTHLDKLVMAALLYQATLTSMGVDSWTIWVYKSWSNRTLIEFLNRIGFDVPCIILSLVLLVTGDSENVLFKQ